MRVISLWTRVYICVMCGDVYVYVDICLGIWIYIIMEICMYICIKINMKNVEKY